MKRFVVVAALAVLPVTLGKMDAVEEGCAAAVEIEDAGFAGA